MAAGAHGLRGEGIPDRLLLTFSEEERLVQCTPLMPPTKLYLQSFLLFSTFYTGDSFSLSR